jgi:hypothetical protein
MMENIQDIQITQQQYPEENIFTISVPIKINRRGGKTATMILPKNIPKCEEWPYYDQVLIRAFSKAYKWQQILRKDPNISYGKLAAKEKVTTGYVSRILRLNQVAPDIVKAIVEGRQPKELKIQDFMNRNIPDLWEDQREVFGFNSL